MALSEFNQTVTQRSDDPTNRADLAVQISLRNLDDARANIDLASVWMPAAPGQIFRLRDR